VYKETGEWRSKKTKLRFIGYKLLNLGVPYVVFSIGYIFLNSFVEQANTQSSLRDALFIWKTPVAQYWFLYALFFLFCIWTAFSGILKNWLITLIVVAIGYIVPLCGGTFGSFDVVFSTAIAFGLGTCVSFARLVKLPNVWKVVVIVAHVAVAVLLIVYGLIKQPVFKDVMFLFGIYASVLLIALVGQWKPIERFLLFVNKYSFQIYLLHTIFTAGIRVVLVRVGMTNWVIHVVVGLICGLFFSVLAAWIANKTKWLDLLFFPSKAYRTIKEKKTGIA
jgi:hypothetical protein